MLNALPTPTEVRDDQLRAMLIQLMLTYDDSDPDPAFKRMGEKHKIIKTLFEMNHTNDSQSEDSEFVEALTDALQKKRKT